MTLCEKLTQARKAAGLTQADVAARLDVSRQAVSRWEGGQSKPSTERLLELARIYDVSLDWLCSDASEVDDGALLHEKKLDDRDPARKNELYAEGEPQKRKKWLGIMIAVLIFGLLLSAYVVLSKKAESFLNPAKRIDDLAEENVNDIPESNFEFDWQGE